MERLFLTLYYRYLGACFRRMCVRVCVETNDGHVRSFDRLRIRDECD
jgi:hypothetical protein